MFQDHIPRTLDYYVKIVLALFLIRGLRIFILKLKTMQFRVFLLRLSKFQLKNFGAFSSNLDNFFSHKHKKKEMYGIVEKRKNKKKQKKQFYGFTSIKLIYLFFNKIFKPL